MRKQYQGKKINSDSILIGWKTKVDGKTYIFPKDGLDSYDNYEVEPKTVKAL